jgi:hypothetical protein
MCSPPNGFTTMTPPCGCSPGVRPNIARIWTYVRDDRPFGGLDPPAALFHYSRDPAYR